jgi:hypothetical protein
MRLEVTCELLGSNEQQVEWNVLDFCREMGPPGKLPEI